MSKIMFTGKLIGSVIPAARSRPARYHVVNIAAVGDFSPYPTEHSHDVQPIQPACLSGVQLTGLEKDYAGRELY